MVDTEKNYKKYEVIIDSNITSEGVRERNGKREKDLEEEKKVVSYQSKIENQE